MVRRGRDLAVIQLRLLGAVDARDGQGRVITALLAQPRRLGLLAFLLIESIEGACPRERVMAMFWPDHGPEPAAENLRQALAFLRRHLGAQAILAHGRHALSIAASEVRCDAVEALRTGAAPHSAGEFLAGVHLDGVGEFWEEWLQAQRRRLAPAPLAAPASTEPTLPSDPTARAAYLHGRFYWTRRPRESAKALASLERAVALAPAFAPAHAALADVYNTLGSWESGALTPTEAFPRAQQAARSALTLDPCCAAAHTSLAYATAHFDWDWTRAEQEFDRAVTLDPTYGHAHHWRAHLLVMQRRFADALDAGRRALELQPLDVIINGHMAWHHWMAREPDAAIDQADRTAYLDETDHWAPFFRGMGCALCGRHGDAVDALRLACTLSKGNAVMRAGLGYVYAAAGDAKAARQVAREFDAAAAEQHRYAYEAAVIHATLGEADIAFARLRDALAARSGWMPYLGVDPRLDPLRCDARFAGLERVLGLPPGPEPGAAPRPGAAPAEGSGRTLHRPAT